MKKFIPVNKVKGIVTKQTLKLSEKAIARGADANNFLTSFADAFLFIILVIKE